MPDTSPGLSTALADRYRIERHAGEGGMATVYLAHDIRHDRKVALKVLRPELAAVIGAERFLQEIKVTANLQHPHILPLHDSGDADGFLYYVMPYIEGDTLRDKLKRERQLTIDDAIEITRSIASALDYAHRQGVIHRDIKPENILLHDGQAMVADFGIALAVSEASGQRLTETGLSIGTPHYMSPEQAMGDRDLDARADVYSLGAMLYEMLAGDPPYTGNTAQAIVAKVITEKAPPVTAIRDTVPGHVNAAIVQALAKMPADRFSTAAAFADALANPGFALPAAATAPGEAGPVPSRSQTALRLLGVATLVFAGLAIWGWLRPAPEIAGPVIRYELDVPELEVGLVTTYGSNIALSPDGRRLVYAGAGENGVQLWLRERNQMTAQALAGGEGAHQPFFSPDGQRVGFITGSRALRIVSLSGEPPVTLVDSGIVRGGGTWGDDGYVYFVAGSGGQGTLAGLSRMLATGGPIETVTVVDTAAGVAAHSFPDALPNGRGILFALQTQLYDAEQSQIAVVDLDTREHRALLAGAYVRWSPTGHLIVVRADGSLVAAPFDPDELALTGPAMPLLEGVSVDGLGTSDITLSASGTLMYQGGNVDEDPTEITWVSRSGVATPVDTTWTGRFVRSGALSPDGRRLALGVFENGRHVWIKQLDAGPLTKMTFEGSLNVRPSWTPDGRSVLFVSTRGENRDLYIRRADGSTAAELLLDHERPIGSAFYSFDGQWLVYNVLEGPTGSDIFARRVGDTTEIPVVAGAFDQWVPTLSPNGRWLAYVSNESGGPEVYVRPFPTEQARWQISNGGGLEPLWSHSGRELFYKSGTFLEKIDVVPGPTFEAGIPTRLFSTEGFANSDTYRGYDIAPDDKRFVMSRLHSLSADARLIVVDNWFTELRERVARQ